MNILPSNMLMTGQHNSKNKLEQYYSELVFLLQCTISLRQKVIIYVYVISYTPFTAIITNKIKLVPINR